MKGEQARIRVVSMDDGDIIVRLVMCIDGRIVFERRGSYSDREALRARAWQAGKEKRLEIVD